MTFAQGFYDYFRECPLFDKGNRLNFNSHGVDSTEYIIEAAPSGNVVQQYVSGSKVKEKLIALGSVEEYAEDARVQIQNSGFYEKLEKWVGEQNALKNFPETPDGTHPLKLECMTDGYLFTTNDKTALYQIQLKLTYIQGGNN